MLLEIRLGTPGRRGERGKSQQALAGAWESASPAQRPRLRSPDAARALPGSRAPCSPPQEGWVGPAASEGLGKHHRPQAKCVPGLMLSSGSSFRGCRLEAESESRKAGLATAENCSSFPSGPPETRVSGPRLGPR